MILDMESFDAYYFSISEQADEAAAKLEAFIEGIDFSGGYEQKKLARNSVIEYMHSLVSVYGDCAATVAADFYNEIAERAGEGVASAELASIATEDTIARSVRYHAKYLFGAEVDKAAFLAACISSAKRYIKQAANETMAKNAVRDGKEHGAKFARVPQGAETCAFCLMLAGRDFIYANKKNAGEMNHFHDNCDCKVIAGFGDDAGVEGYDPAEYYKVYSDNRVLDEYGAVNLDETLNSARRSIYDSIKDARNSRRRELYAKKKALKSENKQL